MVPKVCHFVRKGCYLVPKGCHFVPKGCYFVPGGAIWYPRGAISYPRGAISYAGGAISYPNAFNWGLNPSGTRSAKAPALTTLTLSPQRWRAAARIARPPARGGSNQATWKSIASWKASARCFFSLSSPDSTIQASERGVRTTASTQATRAPGTQHLFFSPDSKATPPSSQVSPTHPSVRSRSTRRPIAPSRARLRPAASPSPPPRPRRPPTSPSDRRGRRRRRRRRPPVLQACAVSVAESSCFTLMNFKYMCLVRNHNDLHLRSSPFQCASMQIQESDQPG